MKNRKSYQLVILFLIGVIFNSCQKDDENLHLMEETEQVATRVADNDGMIQLGKKLKSPYSTKNMRKALGNLKKKSMLRSAARVTTTHLYLKIIPKNDYELSLLKRDDDLILYEYPLDYEIKRGGSYYRDPKVPAGQPTYQYCTVKVGKELPKGIQYEVLEELYIPDDYSDKGVKVKDLSTEDVEHLVDEALLITDNLKNLDKDESYTRARKWTPAGRIRVWDNSLSSWVGVEGVKVRARRWYTTHLGFPDATGRYVCSGQFRNKANYSINWERNQFSLQDGALNGATYNGPKRKGDWNLDLSSGKQRFYATIFRAAYHYYYQHIRGLRRPPQNKDFKTQMKIRAHNYDNGDTSGNHKEERRFLGAQIKIFNPHYTSEQIYGTTIHELAHASHWNMWRNRFDDTERIVKESWARGVEWELSRMRYTNYAPAYCRLRYTGVVEDMIDGTKTTTSNFYWSSPIWTNSVRSYSDRASGYTIRQIEDALSGRKTWDEWKNNIINKYNNGTREELHDTFNHWNLQ